MMPPDDLPLPTPPSLPTPSDAALSTPPPAGAASDDAALEATGFKWGSSADVPAYLQGRSAAETLDIISKLESAVRYVAQAAAPAQPKVEPMPEPTTQIDDDLLVTNPAEWRRRFAAEQEQRTAQVLAQAAAPVYGQLAANAASNARRNPAHADVAERWWTEVETMVAPVPAHMRSEALYDQAVKMARANHLDEIATERAGRLAAAGAGVEGVTAGRGPQSADPAVDALWDKIGKSALGAKMIERYGKSKVASVAKEFGGLDKYADMIAGSHTVFDPDKPSIMHTELSR